MIVEDPSLNFELSGFKRGQEVSLDMKQYLVCGLSRSRSSCVINFIFNSITNYNFLMRNIEKY